MTWGELSAVLVWAATAAYTIATVAYAVDLARRADRAAARAQTPVAVGAAGAADDALRATGTANDESRPRRATGDTSAAGLPTRNRAAGIARATAWLGLVLHLVAIVLRGVEAGRAPWANMYEFTVMGAFVAMAVFLLLQQRLRIAFVGTFVAGIAATALTTAQAAFYVDAEGVQPALQSYWLVLHVGVAIAATGIFTVAFVLSVLQLLRDSRDGGSTRLSGPRWRVLDTISTPRVLEAASFRLNAVGFVLWTLTVIGGAVWAEDAWGRYWGWDAKEVWSFVIWIVYAAYLHARTTRGWSGRRAAWFVVVGYACVIFNFTAVNLVFQGLHSYSGLPTT